MAALTELEGQVAVVTGAASGIGYALTRRFLAAGMSVTMADIETPRLDAEVNTLRAEGAPVHGVQTDVSDPVQVDRLAAETLNRFGRIDVICNNAGVSASSRPAWEVDADTWRWLLGVNLGGVINGIRTFTPLLRDQGSGHIVNIASFAGLVTGPGIAAYAASKHAIVALTECLYKDLLAEDSPVGVTLVCPGFVHTGLLDAERNRPGGPRQAPRSAALAATLQATAAAGLQPNDIARQTLDAMVAGRFWVLTHPARSPAILQRVEQMVGGIDPQPGYPT